MNIQPSYSIRKAQLSDSMYFYNAVCSSTILEKEVNDFDEHFKKMLKSKHQLFFVLETAQKIYAGCAILEIRKNILSLEPFIEIDTFYIDPKYRKWKGADFFYSEIEEQVRQGKVFKLKVSCNLNSTLNQNFYTKRGYKIFKKQYQKLLL